MKGASKWPKERLRGKGGTEHSQRHSSRPQRPQQPLTSCRLTPFLFFAAPTTLPILSCSTASLLSNSLSTSTSLWSLLKASDGGFDISRCLLRWRSFSASITGYILKTSEKSMGFGVGEKWRRRCGAEREDDLVAVVEEERRCED